MEPRMGHRKALFDIGITGPLAGLVPTIIFLVIGLHYSEFVNPYKANFSVGAPLAFEYLANWILGPPPAGRVLEINPMAFAGWVGLLITSLNLMPIGQLDGGHVLYALLRQKANRFASLLLIAALIVVALDFKELYVWTLMLILLVFMGPKHPPTANDSEPLGIVRTILGWLTLAFIIVGFTPTPFQIR
jgi:membrane-associated protease RseP (regulator of RpoE activity)